MWVDEHRGQAERQRVLGLQQQALDDLPADVVGLRTRLRVRLAAEAVYDGADVGPVFDALAEARRVGDQRVLAEALSLSHHALLAPEHLADRLPIAEELIAVGSRAGDGSARCSGCSGRPSTCSSPAIRGPSGCSPSCASAADVVGCRSISYVVTAIDVMRLIRDGQLAEAESAAERCFELGVEVGDADATGYYGAHLLTIRWLQDRQLELLDTAREIADSATLVTPEFAFRATAAGLAARAGRCDEARARLRDVTANGLSALPRSSTWLMGIAVIADVARLVGDADLAAEAHRLLLPFADRPLMPSLAVSCFGSTEWPLGIAAATVGDVDDAIDHLTRAVDANVRLGHRPMTMMVHAELADVLISRGRVGDIDRAVDSWRRAAEISDEIGVPTRAAEWRARAEHAGGEVVDPDAGVLRQDGDRWLVVAGSRRASAPDLVGVHYLATLLTHPGSEVSAVELCGGATADGDGQQLVDQATLNAYRRRVEDIDQQIAAAAGPAKDRPRIRRLRDERDALRAELSSVLAMSGRSRTFTDSAERAARPCARRSLGPSTRSASRTRTSHPSCAPRSRPGARAPTCRTPLAPGAGRCGGLRRRLTLPGAAARLSKSS